MLPVFGAVEPVVDFVSVLAGLLLDSEVLPELPDEDASPELPDDEAWLALPEGFFDEL